MMPSSPSSSRSGSMSSSGYRSQSHRDVRTNRIVDEEGMREVDLDFGHRAGPPQQQREEQRACTKTTSGATNMPNEAAIDAVVEKYFFALDSFRDLGGDGGHGNLVSPPPSNGSGGGRWMNVRRLSLRSSSNGVNTNNNTTPPTRSRARTQPGSAGGFFTAVPLTPPTPTGRSTSGAGDAGHRGSTCSGRSLGVGRVIATTPTTAPLSTSESPILPSNRRPSFSSKRTSSSSDSDCDSYTDDEKPAILNKRGSNFTMADDDEVEQFDMRPQSDREEERDDDFSLEMSYDESSTSSSSELDLDDLEAPTPRTYRKIGVPRLFNASRRSLDGYALSRTASTGSGLAGGGVDKPTRLRWEITNGRVVLVILFVLGILSASASTMYFMTKPPDDVSGGGAPPPAEPSASSTAPKVPGTKGDLTGDVEPDDDFFAGGASSSQQDTAKNRVDGAHGDKDSIVESSATPNKKATTAAAPPIIDEPPEEDGIGNYIPDPAVVEFLSTVSDPKAFEDRTSPQFKAMRWLSDDQILLDYVESHPPGGVAEEENDVKAVPVLERYALATFYYYTSEGVGSAGEGDGGEEGEDEEGVEVGWILKDKWLSDSPVCEWAGVTCGDGRVTGLVLKGNNLRGEVPSELGLLEGLERLVLSENGITGFMPSGGTTLLTNLVELRLDHNELSGELVDAQESFGELINLVILDISNNNFVGSIPSWLELCEKLEELGLSNNELVNRIPTLLRKLINLTKLDLSDNRLDGVIPEEIGDLKNLKELKLSNNELSNNELSNNERTSPIPKRMVSLVSLEELRLDNNKLTGKIPGWVENLQELEILDLHGNVLSGDVPQELGALVGMTELYLHGNDLKGSMPEDLCKMDRHGDHSLTADCADGAEHKVECECCTKCYPSDDES